jgi:hypothetical protein
MTRNPAQPDWVGRFSIALLLASLVVVGIRAHRTSALALYPDRNAASQPGIPKETPVYLTEYASSGRPMPARDPFQYLETTIPRKQPVEPVEDKTQSLPELGALLYDTINPQVQLRVSGVSSGWLSEGAVFNGWVVEAIQPDAVTVQKQGERLVLR